MIDFGTYKNIYFIGIGGIGMSALARMMHAQGKQVSGSDRTETRITDELRKEGILVFIGHAKKRISSDIDAIIYTIAVEDDNPELTKARSLGIPAFSYPEALGLISRDLYTIAISGTHGKTTTTAMIGKILSDARRFPTIIVGSLLKEEKTNFVSGSSDLFVVEACEYKRSFLHLHPAILVIMNIDNDHLDYYKNMRDIQSAFGELARKVPKEGYIVTNPRDASVAPALQDVSARIVDYTLQNTDSLTLQVSGLPAAMNAAQAGAHNVSNARAALAVSEILAVPREGAFVSLSNFSGTWRRFEYKGKTKNGARVYDDYAHHPTEIKATLKAARESFSDKKLIVIFQPHLYSRTQLLLDEFSKSFSDADEVVVAPIYAAREAGYKNVNSQILAEEIKKHKIKTVFCADFEDIIKYAEKHTGAKDVIITMGAGDVYKVGERLMAGTM